MSKVIMAVGMPASGKTHTLRPFAKRNDYYYLSSDLIREEMTGSEADHSTNQAVWAEMYSRLAIALEQGKDVVVDATFVNSDERRDFIAYAKECGASKVQGVFMDVKPEIINERNQSRERTVPGYAMDRMYNLQESALPSIDDGFDSVFDLDENGELLSVEMVREIDFGLRAIDKEFKPRY